MNTKKIDHSVKAALVADSYLLGSHWIYEVAELQKLEINWEELNAPCAQWHEGKEKGDFTHYGDHAIWLDTFVKETKSFDVNAYALMWFEKMKMYKGYADASCRDTLEILHKDKTTTKCSSSGDLSIVGSISPLLYVSSNKQEFLENVQSFIAFTHNNERVLNIAAFFASVLYDVMEGSSIKDALDSTVIDKSLEDDLNTAKLSVDKDTLETIYTFGPGCSSKGAFEGTIHLLLKYDDYKESMIANAKTGGDSASRGMIIAMLMGASDCDIPASWIKGTKQINT